MMPEQRLWRAVIMQAFQDMLGKLDDHSHHKNYDQLVSRHWLLEPSKDLQMVCDLAGYRMGDVIKNAKRLRGETKLAWRAEARNNPNYERRKKWRMNAKIRLMAAVSGDGEYAGTNS